MTIEYRMYLKFLQESCYLGWFKTSQALWSAGKKTRLNSLRDNFIAKSSRLSTKMSLSSLFNFLFPFLSFIGVFSIMKCKTLLLKTTTWWTRASHFVDGWHLLKVSKPASSPPPMELEISSLAYNGVFLHFNYIRDERYLSQWRILFFPCISLQVFPLEISLQHSFLWNHL